MNKDLKQLYLGAGCFWNSQRSYKNQPGVTSTEVGWCNYYINDQPQSGESRVEVVKIEYDPNHTSINKLVDLFWTTHNPKLEKNRDKSFVERSVLLALDENQKQQLQGQLDEKMQLDPEVLTVVRSSINYERAPEKDQDYYA